MSKSGKSNQWTQGDKARVMSATSKQCGGQLPKGHWATKVQSKVDGRNAPPPPSPKKNS